ARAAGNECVESVNELQHRTWTLRPTNEQGPGAEHRQLLPTWLERKRRPPIECDLIGCLEHLRACSRRQPIPRSASGPEVDEWTKRRFCVVALQRHFVSRAELRKLQKGVGLSGIAEGIEEHRLDQRQGAYPARVRERHLQCHHTAIRVTD